MITYRSSGNHMIMSPQYYRMGFFGGDISKPLGQFVLRGEAAFNVDKHFSYKPEAGAMEQKGFNTVNYLVGVDWYAPHEWMVMAQFSSESILRYENQIAQPRHQSLLTLNVSKNCWAVHYNYPTSPISTSTTRDGSAALPPPMR